MIEILTSDHQYWSYISFINPLLCRLFLDHDFIFYFKTTLKKIKKKLRKVLNTFENIMENEAFAL